jgi:hypothetical protein
MENRARKGSRPESVPVRNVHATFMDSKKARRAAYSPSINHNTIARPRIVVRGVSVEQ